MEGVREEKLTDMIPLVPLSSQGYVVIQWGICCPPYSSTQHYTNCGCKLTPEVMNK